MEISRQSQTAGDNAQQIQTQTVYIANGISEQRVREICSEVAARAIADNSLEASNVAMQRIERFVDLLLPRMQRIEKDFVSFADPAFQVLLRKLIPLRTLIAIPSHWRRFCVKSSSKTSVIKIPSGIYSLFLLP